MNTITDQQAENTRVAYSIMAGIPSELINLNIVRENDATDTKLLECGTVACIAGWLSAHPYFKEQGFRRNAEAPHAYHMIDLDLDLPLFGSQKIFSVRKYPRLTQKQESLERLRLHLLRTGHITSERNKELASKEAMMG